MKTRNTKINNLEFANDSSNLKLCIAANKIKEHFGTNSRITRAILNIALSNPATSTTVFEEGNALDTIVLQDKNDFKVDITESVSKAYRSGENAEILFSGLQTTNVSAATSFINISYEEEAEYSDFHKVIEKTLGNDSKILVDISTGGMEFTHHDLSEEVGNIPVSISHQYNSMAVGEANICFDSNLVALPKSNCGNDFRLNVEQYVAKGKADSDNEEYMFCYVMADGKTCTFEHKYYYEKPVAGEEEKTEKVYLKKEEISVGVDGKLTCTKDGVEFNVKQEQTAENGLQLSTTLTEFKGVQNLEQRPDEIASLEEENKSLEANLKNVNASIVDIESNLAQIAEGYNEANNLIASKAQLEENALVLKQRAKNIITQKTSREDEDSFQDIGFVRQEGPKAVQKATLNAQLGVMRGIETVCPHNLKSNDTCKYRCADTDNSGYIVPTSDFRYVKCNNNVSGTNYRCSEKLATYCSYKAGVYDWETVFGNSGFEGLLKKQKRMLTNKRARYGVKVKLSGSSSQKYVKVYEIVVNSTTNAEEKILLPIEINHDLLVKVIAANFEYSTTADIAYNLCEVSLQYDNVLREIENIENRLKYYQIETEDENTIKYATAENATSFADELSKETNEGKYDFNIFTQYRNLLYRLETLGNEKQTLQARIEKNRLYIEKYKAQTPTLFIKGIGTNVLCFTPVDDKNNLFVLTDILGEKENRVHFEYERGRLVSVTDGEKECIKLEYNNSGKLKSIAGASGKKVKFHYNGDLLNKIVHTKGETTLLTYYENRIFGVYTSIGEGVKISTQNGQVSEIYDLHIHSVIDRRSKVEEFEQFAQYYIVSKTQIDYKSLYSATIRKDILQGTDWKNASAITCQFDEHGRVVCEHDGYGENAKNAISYCYNGKNKSFKATALKCAKELAIDTQNGNQAILNNQNPLYSITLDHSKLKKGDYILSAFAKADSQYICNNRFLKYSDQTTNHEDAEWCNSTGRTFNLCFVARYSDGTMDGQSCSFDCKINDWQYLAFPVSIDEEKKDLLTYAMVYASYVDNNDNCIITSLSLKEATWEYAEYDDENKITYSENSENNSFVEYHYNADKTLQKSVLNQNGKQFETNYTYDLNGNLIKEVDFSGMTTEKVVEDKTVKTITYNVNNPSQKFVEEQLVDDKGRELAAVEPLGEFNQEEYVYNKDNTLNFVKSANGQKTSFAYNDNGEVIAMSASLNGEANENQTHYNLGFLTEHTHNDTEYEYSYYNTGKIKSVSIAGKLLANYEYSLEDFAEVNQKYGTIAQPINAATEYFSVEKVTLASGEQFVNVFEPKGKLVKRLVSKNGGAFEVLLENGYDEYDNFVASIDKASGEMYNESVGYDIKGRVQTTTVGNVNVGYTYNDNNQLQTEQVELAGNVVDYQYTYEDTPNARLKAVVVNGKENNVEYDCLGRVASLSNDVFGKKLSYLTNGERTTKLVSKVTYNKNGKTDGHIRYTYDKMGNIERVIENGFEVVRYWYDGVNRLVREDNKSFDETYTYLYDKGGNILQKSVYNYENAENLIALPIRTFDYVYRTNGWNDQLLEWNGKAFEYDSLGNPTTYRDKALVWKNGRQLASFDSVNFTYLSNGTRRTKTTNGGTKTFHYVGEKLIGESTITYDILFHYGLEGVSGFDYVDKSTGIKQEFTYRKNIQGDIVGIYADNGELVAKYAYDAWGNHLIFEVTNGEEIFISESGECRDDINITDHIALINPIRYRGYYFDSETSLYYLMSRYYDPVLGRFITADSIEYLDPESINGLNLYVYCLNNPVMLVDYSGNIPFANTYYQTYFETIIFGFDNKLLGRIYYSQAQIIDEEEKGLLYAYANTNLNGFVSSYGVGMNLFGILGTEVGYSSGNLVMNLNISPHISFGSSIGVSGISLYFQINTDKTFHKVSFGIGLAPVAAVICAVLILGSGGYLIPQIVEWFEKIFA